MTAGSAARSETGEKPFRREMQPWRDLAPYARRVYLPRNQVEVFLYDANPGGSRTLLLIHGLGDEADTWRYLIPPLAEEYRVVALDLPGFGRSQAAPGGCSVPINQEVILELMGSLGIGSALLVGHSYGAVLAQAIARDQPQRVQGLALLSGSMLVKQARINLATLLFMIPGVGEWLYTRMRRDPEAAYRSLEAYYHHLADLPEEDCAFLYQRVNERVWSDRQRKAFFSALRNLARWLPAQQRRAMRQQAGLKTHPTLVIWGGADRMADIRSAHAFIAQQASARLVIVADAGHNLHQEKPAPVVNAIRELAQVLWREATPA